MKITFAIEIKDSVIDYVRETWKNKIAALLLILIGYATLKVSNDGTGLLFILLMAIPLFFSKRNCIMI